MKLHLKQNLSLFKFEDVHIHTLLVLEHVMYIREGSTNITIIHSYLTTLIQHVF